MQYRVLGKSELKVSALGLGCLGMTQPDVVDEAESMATLHRAIELGINFFDTAELYGPYKNEQLLGRTLKPYRDQLIIASKFGYQLENGRVVGVNSKPKHIRQVVEASLKRLDTEYIDLLYQHRVDPEVPIEEVVGVMAEFVKAGKVRYLGLSEAGVHNISRAHAVHPITALQSEYSLWERELEAEVLPLLRQLGISLVAYSPLGKGFFTGKAKPAEDYPVEDYRRRSPRLMGGNFAKNSKIAKVVEDLARQKGNKPAQVALAWLLHQGKDIVPIPGTKQRQYLQENVAAVDLILSAADLDVLNQAVPQEGAAGPRYNENGMKYIDR